MFCAVCVQRELFGPLTSKTRIFRQTHHQLHAPDVLTRYVLMSIWCMLAMLPWVSSTIRTIRITWYTINSTAVVITDAMGAHAIHILRVYYTIILLYYQVLYYYTIILLLV